MRGIGGWLYTGRAAGNAHEAASEFMAASRLAGGMRMQHGPGGTFAMNGGPVPASAHREGALLVAVEGRLTWRDDELADTAARGGPGAAVMHAYRKHGVRCLEHIGGTFAIAIVDTESSNALIAIDRMGIGTLCYATPSGNLVVGTDAETVASHAAVGRRLDVQGIFNYLYCHVVPSPGTVFTGVDKLQPGECVEFRNGRTTRRFYWQMKYSDASGESFDSMKSRFRTKLRNAASRAVASDKDIGAFLSGGTDSSTVTGLLAEVGGSPPRTYSIGFAAEGFDEIGYARIAASRFGAAAREYYVTPQDVVDAIPLIARTYDEPFGNASAVPTYYCARMARADGVSVMLAGDGGDEIFGGNARYAWQKIFEAYQVVPGPVRAMLEPIAFGVPAGDRLAPTRKLRSYIAQARVPLPERLESYNFLQRSPLPEVFEPDFLAAVDPRQPLELQAQVYRRAQSASPVNRMMHLDLKFTLADNDLRKVTRMCEAAGVEVRYPLIDDDLVAFSGEIPASLKVRRLRLRHFFKEALRDFLPPEILSKTKHGFGLPFGLWMKEHAGLAGLAHDSLAAFERRGIMRPAYTRGLLAGHASSHATYFGVMIWVVMMLEHWLASRRM